MASCSIHLTETDIRDALVDFIKDRFGVTVQPDGLEVQVKSTQNYKSEWEKAAIRVNVTLPVVSGRDF